MKILPDDARLLLSEQSLFAPESEWVIIDSDFFRYEYQIGLLNGQKNRANLVVKFICSENHKTRKKILILSIFKPSLSGYIRVYQVEAKAPIDLKNAHAYPHKHFGTEKIGRENLLVPHSDFGLLLDIFKEDTGIEFEITPVDPLDSSNFKLKPQK